MARLYSMTTQDRIDEISKISGLSADICRRVLNAETESIVRSLRRGERATLAGRVTLRPEIRQKMGLDCEIKNVVKVKAEVSSALESRLSDLQKFENREIEDDIPTEGIRLTQINSLA